MKLTFLAQPFPSFGGSTATWLTDVLVNSSATRLQLAVAWVKRSGLARLNDSLAAFRQRGGEASAIVGIDEGGATAQGLRLAMEVFDSVHIYHERGSRTFHPKVYLASGATMANILIGSSNLTAGGLFSNNEVGLKCELDLKQEFDRALFEEVREWFDMLYSDSEVCLPLTAELLAALLDDPSYRVGDENRPRRPGAPAEEDHDSIVTPPRTQNLFGTSTLRKTGFPPPLQVSETSQGKQRATRRRMRTERPAHRWWKCMPRADAQQPQRGKTNVTGVLRLAKARHPIDSQTYFRHQMFGDAEWETLQTPNGLRDTAHIPFEVVIDGANLGEIKLKVDHSQHREAGQRNIVTLIHWGRLGSALRQTDYTGAWVVLEAWADGRHRLEISWVEPKPFEHRGARSGGA